jgi:hypothetical protein
MTVPSTDLDAWLAYFKLLEEIDNDVNAGDTDE